MIGQLFKLLNTLINYRQKVLCKFWYWHSLYILKRHNAVHKDLFLRRRIFFFISNNSKVIIGFFFCNQLLQ